MDEEDIADAEEAKKLQTTDSFAGFGTSAEDVRRNTGVMDILKTTGETMGVKLLKKMGWREGQGIGPKVRRKAKVDEKDDPGGGGDVDDETHLFAPEDSKLISFTRKIDRKGLGFEGEGHLDEAALNGTKPGSRDGEEDDGLGVGTLLRSSKPATKKAQSRGAFGVGILNDNGSDDEDPYSMGPKVSYNRVMGGDKKKKRSSITKPSANPLLKNKPVFVSKKAASSKTSANFRRCHDGRLPLDGFVLASGPDLSSLALQAGKYSPPEVPEGWKSIKIPIGTAATTSNQTDYRSTADIAKASKLSPKSRAALLGETALPGKSVFDYLTPNARSRIATASNNQNLPPALSEASTQSPTPKSMQSLVPALSPETALTALGRGTAGSLAFSCGFLSRLSSAFASPVAAAPPGASLASFGAPEELVKRVAIMPVIGLKIWAA